VISTIGFGVSRNDHSRGSADRTWSQPTSTCAMPAVFCLRLAEPRSICPIKKNFSALSIRDDPVRRFDASR